MSVPPGAESAIADLQDAIDRAERTCLVSNSLKSDVRVDAHAYVDESVEAHAVA